MSTEGSGPTIATRLIGQGAALGGGAGLLLVAGMALFLAAFGSELLPVVYVAVAVSGAAASFALTRAERRFGLQRTAVVTVGTMAVLAASGWLAVSGGIDQGAGLALVLFSVYLQLGFVLIGGQVGQAFDVAEVKATFPRIVAGFAAGFMVSGIVANVLSAALGGPTALLLVAAVVLVGQATLMNNTIALLPAATPAPATGSSDAPTGTDAVPLRAILGSPLVIAVFVYQLLSAMATHLVEFLLFDRAAARIETAAGLASFLGRLTIGLNLTDLVVLVVAGGWLMSRFGLRFGLGANPVLVTALMAVAAVMVAAGGSATLGLLVLLSVAHTVDITAADVATRTSVNATFQALPRRDRIAAQAFVEGVGVPLALGLVAVLIVGLNWLSGGSVAWMVTATVVVCAAWSVSALVVFVRYRSSVVDAVASARLATVELDLDDPTTRAALVTLARTGTDAHVGVVSRLLAPHDTADRAELAAWAARQDRASTAQAALPVLTAARHRAAASVAAGAIAEQDPAVRLQGVRALGLVAPGPEHEMLDTIASDITEAPALRVAALGSLLRAGGPAATEAAREVAALAAGAERARSEAAQAIAAAGSYPDPPVLAALLDDGNGLVRGEAGAALVGLDDGDRAAVIGCGSRQAGFFRHLRSGVGPLVRRQGWDLLAGAGPDRPMVIRALIAEGTWAVPTEHRATAAAVIDAELDRAERAAITLGRLRVEGAAANGSSEPDNPTARLLTAVDTERLDARSRVLDAVTLSVGRAGFGRELDVALSGEGGGDRALALESLDLALPASQRARVVALVTGTALGGDEPPAPGSAGHVVRDLVADPGWAVTSDWIQACALMSLATLEPEGSVPAMEAHGPVSAELAASLVD
ncbi:MAG: hypothetical protein AAF467_14350 [Actinomycetota bacterium]